MIWLFFLISLAVHAPATSKASLPLRLVLLVDGVSYRDMKSLQEGITYQDIKGRQWHRQGFDLGYFPVSRLVSTFPSISDPAWTEILGNRPAPGYQRTYFNAAKGSEIFNNGITSSAEYEKQMTWQMDGNFRRVMNYLFPLKSFKYEVNALVQKFLQTSGEVTNFYAMIHSTDVAQHLSGDIFAMLDALDERLQDLRALYRKREGRELEILILSDHGNNHAGGGKRVAIRSFLEQAGYRITKSIKNSKDIVLPTAGIESWVEIHNSPGETERLAQLLSHLEGVDILTARIPDQTNRFIVLSSKDERAVIERHAAKNSFRYSTEVGDPLGYLPVAAALAKKGEIDSDGFATADDWMAETFGHRYPLALERIARGHTQIAINPASILISLKEEYIHSDWLIKKGVDLVTSGGTHGGLDDINSNGILLSSFAPTKDTSTDRVAALFDGFKGLRDYRATERGAEWVYGKADGTETIAQAPLDARLGVAPSEKLFLRIWTPAFTRLDLETPLDVTIEKARSILPAHIRRTDPKPIRVIERYQAFHCPLSDPPSLYERVYAFPANLILQPKILYRVSGYIRDPKKNNPIFKFTFRTDSHGLPIAR